MCTFPPMIFAAREGDHLASARFTRPAVSSLPGLFCSIKSNVHSADLSCLAGICLTLQLVPRRCTLGCSLA